MVEENYKSLNLGKRQFPSFKPPGAITPEDYLRQLCEQGMRERFGDSPTQVAIDRLDHELGIINRMGFASYFLIVWDFVRFAREQGIPNSARGSACGAVVSYLLYLSHVDPLKYDLLFERFLDPNRSEAPDIDIDLCKDRRVEVIAYVREKYGAANVAQIGTFGTMAAKASIKDVSRTLGIPLARVDEVTKLIPTRPNITLETALEEEPQLRKLLDSDPELRRMFDFAQRLEGTVRNVGTHAAGVVIADRPLRDLVPLQKIPNKDKDKEVVSTQWEMGDVEKAGGPPDPRPIPRPADRPQQTPARRRANLRAAPAWRGQGPVPARRRGDPRPPREDEARPVRRPDRYPGALSPGSAQRRDG
jgi:DNA polymerase-3 subunit alpha